MSDFRSYLARSREHIQQEIESAFGYLQDLNPELATEHGVLIDSVQGGKNIRGSLVQIGYRLTGSVKNDEVWKIAAAFEILHASLLIHDDIIDKSSIRRGKSTAHVALGGDHYGISQSICLGDMGFFLATHLIAESKFPGGIKSKIIALFSKMVMDTIIGEMLDVKISQPGQDKREDVVLSMQRLKTASYTVVGPLIVGAMLGRASRGRLSSIRRFGEHIGMAFQIQDDILGVFGDEKAIGKSVTSDIEENKSTLLIVHALQKATPLQKRFLQKLYGKEKISLDQHKKIKEIFEETGSLAYSRIKVGQYVAEGKRYISRMTKDAHLQNMLIQFADFVIERRS
jgi:geranylgeranyl diphosphate synthase type I